MALLHSWQGMCIDPGRRVPAVLLSIIKSEEKLFYWGIIKYPEVLEWYEICGRCCRSWYHLRISDSSIAKVWMAGEDAKYGTKIVDSRWYSIAIREEWENMERSASKSLPRLYTTQQDVRNYSYARTRQRLSPAVKNDHTRRLRCCAGIRWRQELQTRQRTQTRY